MEIKRLPDAELDVMLAVWKGAKQKSASEILVLIGDKRGWGLPTLSTVLTRLVNKGFLACTKEGRNNFYTALISEEEYRSNESKTLLEKLYGNSISSLVSSLFSSEAIDEKDIAELQQALDSLRKDE